MKRLLNFWLATAYFLFMSTGSYAHQTANPVSLDQTIGTINTPKAIVDLMKKKFTFVEDDKLFGRTDYWQSPEELWSRKASDCEDYALFAQSILRKNGIEAEVLSIYGTEGYAHTIVIFKEDGLFRILNQAKLERFRAKSIHEAIEKLNPEWTWAAIAEEHNHRGKSIKTILRLR